MFENTSTDMQEIIDKMYQDDFHPDKLSKTERRAFDALYDQVQTMYERLEEIEEMIQTEEEAAWIAEEAEEARQEEYEMHKAIVGEKQADEDFHTFTRKD
jgi:uncharacterized membrane protein YgaE (UPF0421/DUF939 family)